MHGQLLRSRSFIIMFPKAALHGAHAAACSQCVHHSCWNYPATVWPTYTWLQDICHTQLSWLRHLSALEDVTLGCHHRLIASTVTDRCLAELVTLTSLKSLNLSQCVHVGDGGELISVIMIMAYNACSSILASCCVFPVLS